MGLEGGEPSAVKSRPLGSSPSHTVGLEPVREGQHQAGLLKGTTTIPHGGLGTKSFPECWDPEYAASPSHAVGLEQKSYTLS